jgi:Protein of unknown function (DUF3300)/Chaperone of endosialidase
VEAAMALHRLVALVLAFLILTPFTALAQNQAPPAPATSDQLLKPEELDALVAGIALYPDTLLSLVLMASTYPLEVVQADRWAKENKNLKGDQLKAAVDKQGWDDSVKSLVATPDVLSMMSTKLDWTQKLGDAVLAQQPDVMDAIQRLRTKADANKKLTSTKEQKVTKKQEQGKQVIVIEPTDPNTVYVPYYDPAVAYGGWPYPAYPPYYFPPPGYIAGGIIAGGIAFGAGYALGRWASGGNYWGGGCNWGGGNINVNRPININNSGNNWQHRPEHRQGVRYNNGNVQQKFGNNNIRGGAQDRMDFRGRGGEQVLKPGGGQANLGDRGGANRPGAGGAGTQRPGAGQKPGGGQRPSAGQKPGGGQRPSAGQRPSGGARPSAGARPGGGGNALGNVGSGGAARAQAARGHASLGGGGARGGGGGGARMGGGGGGARGGGGGGGRGGGGGGGRRSDIMLKHDIVLLGHLDNGLGFYRFSYNGSERAYVGVMAQDVQKIAPEAVTRGRDGYLRVFYDKLGVKFQTYDQWFASGARVPAAVPLQ